HRDRFDLVEVEHRNAERSQALRAGLGAGDRAGDSFSHCAEAVDEVVHRRAGADADDLTRANVVECGQCGGFLECVLVHAYSYSRPSKGWTMTRSPGSTPAHSSG